jgi:hypothetical protein
MKKIIMFMKWDSVTPDQYERLRKIVNWEGNEPKGAVFHLAAFDNSGIRVTDIWESADDFNSFVQTRLMPGTAEVGIPGAPQVEIFPAHAIYVPNPDCLKL